MVACSILGCKSNSRFKMKEVSFHLFPQEPDLRDAWIAATKRINWVPKNSSRICSRHFNMKLLKKLGKRTFLYPDAIPNVLQEPDVSGESYYIYIDVAQQ